MCEGVFLHSHVETAFGPQRGSNGGFFRYDPRTRRLIRHAQFNIPNPWGVAVDEYGQNYFFIPLVLRCHGCYLEWSKLVTVLICRHQTL